MPARPAMFYSGLGCIVFGIAIMYYFQHTHGIGFGTFQCLDKTTGISTDYAQERLVENWHKLFVLDSRAVLGVIGIIAFAAVRVMWTHLALGLTFLALLAATVVFGIVDEMRVWIPFVPLLILAVKE